LKAIDIPKKIGLKHSTYSEVMRFSHKLDACQTLLNLGLGLGEQNVETNFLSSCPFCDGVALYFTGIRSGDTLQLNRRARFKKRCAP